MSRNYSRISYRRSVVLIMVVLAVLVMSWELQKVDAAVAGSHIPEESIRLRILANSDAPADQAVKRVVRDAVVEAMNSWVTGPQTIEEARATMRQHMGEMELLVGKVLSSRGFDYAFHIELGQVPFPTKMYGSEVYPAGSYEALLITLGEGKGQNWWCVLFPPLCFIDVASGEAVAADVEVEPSKAASKEETKEAKASVEKASVQKDNASEVVHAKQEPANSKAEGEAPEAKFFLWEMLQKLMAWVQSLFA